MPYRLAPLYCRPWTLAGLSARLIESHYEVNYGGAVARLNAITEELATLAPTATSAVAINRLKRDELIALNSTLLHELYFASLGGDGRAVPQAMAEAFDRDFGSVVRWQDEFSALGQAIAGGSGWVLLTYLPRDGRLLNQVGGDHGQSIAGGIPILALDMYEHAYHIDFGANAAAYIAAFLRNIDWKAVQGRYLDAQRAPRPSQLEQPEFAGVPAIAPEEVKAMLESGAPVQIIDVRPRHYAAKTHEIMERAVWRDPDRVQEWIGELSKSEPVVTFCVYGFHVGCQTATALREAGFDARYMAGGHHAWKAIKGKTKLFA
ncbi:Fe-Mn family superoxide dismutase [Desertibaculum subflavum]|uniref:Fe-Mn family superoxide dismutase n=1 Tax=Desertibaculum subflavum TaxID=2268458 RepID=UPI000E669C53